MLSSFKLRVVFGLLVLFLFQPFLSKAHFNPFKKSTVPNTLRQRPLSLAIPSSSRTLESHRLRPLHALPSSSVDSMTTINLQSSSSSNIYRSVSSPTLNKVNSPSIMRETSHLHEQAASLLNIERMNIARPPQQNTLHRLIPNSERMKSIGKYLKNVAIAAAGTGGTVSIVNAFSNNDEKNDDKYIVTITSTTKLPEHYNPIGMNG